MGDYQESIFIYVYWVWGLLHYFESISEENCVGYGWLEYKIWVSF